MSFVWSFWWGGAGIGGDSIRFEPTILKILAKEHSGQATCYMKVSIN